jgi:hypothetical protein
MADSERGALVSNKTQNPDGQMLQALHLIGLTLLRGMKLREQVDLMDRAGYGQTKSLPSWVLRPTASVCDSRKSGD